MLVLAAMLPQSPRTLARDAADAADDADADAKPGLVPSDDCGNCSLRV